MTNNLSFWSSLMLHIHEDYRLNCLVVLDYSLSCKKHKVPTECIAVVGRSAHTH